MMKNEFVRQPEAVQYQRHALVSKNDAPNSHPAQLGASLPVLRPTPKDGVVRGERLASVETPR